MHPAGATALSNLANTVNWLTHQLVPNASILILVAGGVLQ